MENLSKLRYLLGEVVEKPKVSHAGYARNPQLKSQ
jgi:hypothetical protein